MGFYCNPKHCYRVNLRFYMIGLYADSIVKQFDTRNVLSDVFITCKSGEVVGLLGRNGSGKSTLLKIIFGSLGADHKYVKVNGKHLKDLKDSVDCIRYLPQDSFLPSHVKIKKLISVFCSLKYTELLIQRDIVKPFLNKYPNELSGGERRILQILMIIYSDAPYILLDEPFNGSSPIQIEMIKDIIREHSNKNKSFIITDHNYSDILDISSRIVLMRDGITQNINELTDLIEMGYLPKGTMLNQT